MQRKKFDRFLCQALAGALPILLLCACKGEQPPAPTPRALPVAAITIHPQDTPFFLDFVGQTESSRRVEIRARVDGFLERIAYKEGMPVKEGEVLFELDKKPFSAALQQAQGDLAQHKARLQTAEANLRRVKPLAEKNAISQKDLDDATGQVLGSRAAVLSAEGRVQQAELNLGYATITSPVTGLTGRAEQREGAYVSPGAGGLLSYVAQLDPIWVTFSISENQLLRNRQQIADGLLKPPTENHYEVEVLLADGSSHPHRGEINFADPSIDPETGTLLIRAELANPEGRLRPGQFVQARLHGATRPEAILVPQDAVMQGAKGHFVWVADQEGKAAVRMVEPGPWHERQWFIEKGLKAGDRVITDNLLKLSQGVPLQISEAGETSAPAAATPETSQ